MCVGGSRTSMSVGKWKHVSLALSHTQYSYISKFTLFGSFSVDVSIHFCMQISMFFTFQRHWNEFFFYVFAFLSFVQCPSRIHIDVFDATMSYQLDTQHIRRALFFGIREMDKYFARPFIFNTIFFVFLVSLAWIESAHWLRATCCFNVTLYCWAHRLHIQ